jgi:hypothetical protein
MKMSDFENRLQGLVSPKAKNSLWLFFVAFSRFEDALKNAGFVKTSWNGTAEANWDCFASKYKDAFDPHSDNSLLAAWKYFKDNPPRKQIPKGKALGWEDSSAPGNEPSLSWLLIMVRRVRNNLFHGGKFPFARIKDPARDPDLLKHSLTVLEACLELNPKVKEKFMEPNE